MTKAFNIQLIAFMALYILIAMSPMFAIIGANYIIEPTRTWGLEMSTGQTAIGWTLFVAWGIWSLRTSLKMTGLHNPNPA